MKRWLHASAALLQEPKSDGLCIGHSPLDLGQSNHTAKVGKINTLTQSNGYITQCSIIPAAAPATTNALNFVSELAISNVLSASTTSGLLPSSGGLAATKRAATLS